MTDDRALDVVVFGATGFTGRLVAGYLAEHAPEDARIGLAGRSEEKLAGVRSGLGARASEWPLVAADSSDPASLARLAGGTRVVATTVGPYARGGLALVEACATAGAHYADLAGEVLFMRDSIDRHHEPAARNEVRIVHSCGFDSIPSDLGVLLLHEAARSDDAGDLEDTTLVVTGAKGSFSGGTFASMKGQLDEARANRERGRIVNDPYALSPDRAGEPDLGDERDLRSVQRDDELGGWLAPFVMATINTRVVRRSNALQDWAYGRRFRYREVRSFGSGLTGPAKAAGVTAGLGALAGGLSFGPTRALLDRVLPAAGEGPDEAARAAGFFRMEIHARTATGARYLCRVAAQGDPGYAATSVMLGESALCLALDGDRLPSGAGVLTPATAMGTALVDRLRAARFT
ncbi:MAG: saccharopine dehydrogenase NADP-binding domain-containing protein, partial [Thermoleophilaceae bacterium]|nr:saccharopine dehydrogenase NADP-binding domain-containing protein [Thermoleophilaceae bacterium]